MRKTKHLVQILRQQHLLLGSIFCAIPLLLSDFLVLIVPLERRIPVIKLCINSNTATVILNLLHIPQLALLPIPCLRVKKVPTCIDLDPILSHFRAQNAEDLLATTLRILFRVQ